VSSNRLEIFNIMEWFPIVAGTFKVLVLGTGMFFAIKWHYDKGKAEKEKKRNNETSQPSGVRRPQEPAEHTRDTSD